jgi:hypothetical protein
VISNEKQETNATDLPVCLNTETMEVTMKRNQLLILLSFVIPLIAQAEDAADPRIPIYQRVRPQWAIEIEGSLSALGGNPSIPNIGSAEARAVLLQFEYQPALIQSAGILGLGPVAALYPMSTTGITNGTLGMYAIGGQARYQARFFREQPIVPMGGYELEYLSYRLADGRSGSFINKGLFFGAMFLLNILDSDAAAEFFVNYGVCRTYLVGELRLSRGGDSVITLDGSSYYAGLRFEF